MEVGNEADGLYWPPLVAGRLIRRYKRFLADVQLADGSTVTVHCPNSGSMAGCSQAGRPVYLSCHNNPARKLKFTWELIEMPTSLVGINTLIPNRLVMQALHRRQVPELADYSRVTAEVTVDSHTRLDLKLVADGMADCYVEIKNCTLLEGDCAMFPDARTVRGEKHLRVLRDLKRAGYRAVMFMVVQRCDARWFAPAEAIDPDYAQALRDAAACGVEILVYDVAIDTRRITLRHPLPCRLFPGLS